MTLFIGILDRLNDELDKCVSLPRSSIARVKSIIKKLDKEEKERIIKGLKEDFKLIQKIAV